MGELQMRVHSTFYHNMAAKEGTYDCWKDEGFRRDVRKHDPNTRVKSGGTKLQVGWTPAQEQRVEIFGPGKTPRFVKKYEGGP